MTETQKHKTTKIQKDIKNDSEDFKAKSNEPR